MIKNDEIYELIKMDDEQAKATIYQRYGASELREVLNKLSEPIKFSFTQRMMLRAFAIDTTAQVNRFVKLIKEVLNRCEEAEIDFALAQQ